MKTLKNHKHDTGSAQGSLYSAKFHEYLPNAHVTMPGEHETMQRQRVHAKTGPRFEAKERFEA